MEITAVDLTKPLGLELRQGRRPSIRLPVAPILAALLAAMLGGAVAYLALADDPLAGRPHAVVPIEIAAAPLSGSSARVSRALNSSRMMGRSSTVRASATAWKPPMICCL